MKIRGWGNLRINFRVLLIALFCAHMSSSFAVANTIDPTYLNIPTTQSVAPNYSTNTEIPILNKQSEINRTYQFVENEGAIFNESLGITAAVEFSIKGTPARNVLNLNNYSGFVISNSESILNLSDLIITGAKSTVGAVINNQTTTKMNISNLTFENNSALSQTSNALGGAIYTKGEMVLTNTSFIGNTATSRDSSSVAQGGAIYAENSIELIADSENVLIVDNFAQSDGSAADRNAIYMTSNGAEESTLKVTANNGGNFYINDNIRGSNYNVVLSGDGTGQIGLFNSIYGANKIDVSNTVVSFCNGQIYDYSLNNLNIGENVEFVLDADLANSVADTISSINPNGTVNVSGLSFISAPTGTSVKFQVLKSPGLTLNIDKLNSKLVTSVQPTMYNDSILANSITLGRTTYSNDSIVINGWKDVLYEMVKDVDYTHMLKNFIFRTNTEYTLTKNLEELGQESILAITNESDGQYGVINANGHSMFKLYKPITKVTLDNILIKNASTTDSGSVAFLDNNTAIFTATNSVITNNKATGDGGAFYVKNGTLTITNSTVSNNTSDGLGGAIYSEGNVEIIADNGTTTFKDNTANGESSAIYVGSPDATLNLTAKNNGVINMDDKIDGTDYGYKLNVNGDSTGNVKINNTVSNATIQLQSGVLSPSIESNLDGNNFIGSGGLLNLMNGSIGTVAFNEVSFIGKTNIAIDADLQNSRVDRIASAVLLPSTSKLNISNINIMSDSIPTQVTVAFAEGGIKSAITNSVGTAYSNIYKYTVSYNKTTGELTFNRGGKKPKPDPDPPGPKPPKPPKPKPTPTSNWFNPNILAAGVAQQLAYLNQLQNYQTAMYHSDAYMMLPVATKMMRNQYGTSITDVEEAFRYCNYQAPIQDEIKSLWVRPYSSFESVPLKRGPSVSNISYGTIFGGDSDLIKLGHGFSFVYGGYVGYNGNSATYEHIDLTQQGAVVGLTANLYKGKFFNTITANCGWMINDTYTWYGTDTMNLIMSGVADRIGYNIEIASGRLIIQPSIFLGYTFVYSSDYTMNNGVEIETDPLNVIHFAPTLKVIGNTKNGWQPYGVVSVMANFMDKTNFTANTIELPQMSIDPYVEYGLGIQRRWNEKCQAFGQATVRNGGRRGVALLFGLKCMVGKITGSMPTIVPQDRITDKKVKFKDRKAPEIEIVDWRAARKRPEPNPLSKIEPKDYPVKVGLWDKFKKLKKVLTLKYNTDVSAKVVSDVYPDGVIMTTLKGQDKNGNYSTFVDMDMQAKEKASEVIIQNLEPEGVIIIDDSAFTNAKTTLAKSSNNVEMVTVPTQSVVAPQRKADLIKRLNKKYAKILKVNQTNYYKQEQKYEFKDYQLEIINF